MRIESELKKRKKETCVMKWFDSIIPRCMQLKTKCTTEQLTKSVTWITI